MGEKMPKYVVFNTNAGLGYHEPVAWGNDFETLMSQYHGKAYQVMTVRSIAERDEW